MSVLFTTPQTRPTPVHARWAVAASLSRASIPPTRAPSPSSAASCRSKCHPERSELTSAVEGSVLSSEYARSRLIVPSSFLLRMTNHLIGSVTYGTKHLAIGRRTGSGISWLPLMAWLSQEALITRRSALRTILTGAGVALLAACGPITPQAAPTSISANSTSPAPTPGGSATASVSSSSLTPQPRTGGTVRYAGLDDITSLDAHKGSSPAFDTMYQVFDRLTEYDLNVQPQPRLAESWDFSADQTQIKLNLRKGVQFHSGRELTSDDVKWNLARVRDPKISNGSVPAQAAWFSGIDTPDKYTVVLKSDQPRPGTFDFFEYVSIMEPVADGAT